MAKQQTLLFAGKVEVDMVEDEGAQTESTNDTTPLPTKGTLPLKRQRRRALPKQESVVCINEDSDIEGGKQKGGVMKPWATTIRVKNPCKKLLRALLEYQQSEGQLELKLSM